MKMLQKMRNKMNINNEDYLKARISAFKFITFKRRTIKETENKLKSLEIYLLEKQ